MSNVIVESAGPATIVTLNRPQARNAINHEMLAAIHSAARAAEQRGDRVFVLKGAGNLFSAGADVKELASFNEQQLRANLELGAELTEWLESGPLVTVALLNGMALGGAFELALACDIRLAAADTLIGLPELSLGSLPGWGGIPRLVRLTPAAAREMILTTSLVDGSRAYALGLVNRVVDDLEAAYEELEASILRAGPIAVSHAKRLIHASANLSMEDGLAESRLAGLAEFGSDERAEGLQAFIEKREPFWRHYSEKSNRWGPKESSS